MGRCDDYESLIERMLSDEIGTGEMDRLLGHAESCGDCREFVELHHRMLGPELDHDLPTEGEFAAVRHTVLRRIREQQERRLPAGWAATTSLLRSLLMRPVYAGALGAVMLAALGAGVLIGAGASSEGPRALDVAALDDPVLWQIGQEAVGNRQLVDSENSPYVYSNVKFDDVGERQMAVSFDVTRHVEVARSRTDPLIKELLVQSLVNPAPLGTRLQAISYTGGLMDPKIKEVLIFSMLNDPNLAVRLKALKILGSREPDDQVRGALTAVLSEDDSVQMRMLAMDHLVASDPEQASLDRVIEDLRAQGDQALLVRVEDYSPASAPASASHGE